jgi:HD-GYP domain-containing protein (c-di-GMP phosphodiesterase class II)
MHQKIAAKDLKVGMFIADLDRPWIDTPFLLQGFLLEDDEQLQQLRLHCHWAMIDPQRSVGKDFDAPAKKTAVSKRDLGNEPRVTVYKSQQPVSPGSSASRPAPTSPNRTTKTNPVSPNSSGAKPGLQEFAISVKDSRDAGTNSAAESQLAPAAARRKSTDASGSTGGFRSLWGNLREGVTNMFGRSDEEKFNDDDFVEATAPAAEYVRPTFIPESVQLTIYEEITTVEAEVGAAGDSFKRTNELLERMAQDIRAGDELKLENIEVVVDDMVESMVRNPDALMWVARMREQDLNIYGHGLSVAINLVAFGRHLGYPKSQLTQLGLLGLLLDVGKIKLPRELLERNSRLTADEFEHVKEHVDFGLEILRETPNIHPDVLEGIAQHHERMNGSGYPNNLLGEKISTFGRMSAIADTYAAVTKPRPYAEVISPHQALQMLSSWSGSQFQSDMVEQFIQSIGVFPVGSMVELSTGEVAVVVTHSKIKRLRPKVLVLTMPDKTLCANPSTRDLLYDVSDSPVYIRCGLPSRAYGIDPRDYYAA